VVLAVNRVPGYRHFQSHKETRHHSTVRPIS